MDGTTEREGGLLMKTGWERDTYFVEEERTSFGEYRRGKYRGYPHRGIDVGHGCAL